MSSQFRYARDLGRGLSHAAAYAAWVLGYKLVVLTLITYFLMASNSRFQEISDAYASNELMLMGLGALLYVLLLRALNPLTSTTTQEVFTPHRFEKRFAPGFAHGAAIALGVTLAFLLSGLYRYLGVYIQFEDAPLALTSVLLRVLAVGALAYCEEFIFRQKIMNSFRRQVPELYAAGLTAVIYCLIKSMQFDLSSMQLFTLFLMSLTLSVRAIADGDFVRGAGFWAGLMIVLHPLLSIPILGNDFQGILLVKYVAQEADDGAFGTFRLLSGGIGGPLSSFAIQLLLVFDIVQGVLKNKKILLNPEVQKIR